MTWALGVALTLGGVQSCAVDVVTLRSGSMVPAVFVGDRGLVDKTAYGWALPFSAWRRGGPIFLTERVLPARGDMIVFRAGGGDDRLLIKRVIGLPGDVVQVRADTVLLDDRALPRQELSASELAALSERFQRAGVPLPRRAFWESVGDTRYPILPGTDERSIRSLDRACLVPPGHLFVLGDNRASSIDSRTWGPIRFEHVVGRLRPLRWRPGTESNRRRAEAPSVPLPTSVP
jgi:signal peptidase I